MSEWTDSLQQASFRGVPFAATAGAGRFGRRVALHEYPNRDKPWPEDMGRQARRFSVAGFLVTDSAIYGGGDVIAQREAMVAAAEAPGSADLVHPTYGRLKVSCLGLDVVERLDLGRAFELTFVFVEAGERQFPAGTTATGDAVNSAADSAASAISGDFVSKLSAALPQMPSLGPLSGLASRFGGAVDDAVRDATSLFHVASQLQGNFGRFAGGGAVASLSSLIGRTAGLRSDVFGRTVALASLPSELGAGGRGAADLASAAFSATSGLRGATGAPRDAVRLLAQLANFGR